MAGKSDGKKKRYTIVDAQLQLADHLNDLDRYERAARKQGIPEEEIREYVGSMKRIIYGDAAEFMRRRRQRKEQRQKKKNEQGQAPG